MQAQHIKHKQTTTNIMQTNKISQVQHANKQIRTTIVCSTAERNSADPRLATTAMHPDMIYIYIYIYTWYYMFYYDMLYIYIYIYIYIHWVAFVIDNMISSFNHDELRPWLQRADSQAGRRGRAPSSVVKWPTYYTAIHCTIIYYTTIYYTSKVAYLLHNYLPPK